MYLRTVTLLDEPTGLYAFVLYHPTNPDEVLLASAPGFDTPEQAEKMAVEWVVSAIQWAGRDDRAIEGGTELRIIFEGCELLWRGRWDIYAALSDALGREDGGGPVASGVDGPRNKAWILCQVRDVESSLAVIRAVLRQCGAPAKTRVVLEADPGTSYPAAE